MPALTLKEKLTIYFSIQPTFIGEAFLIGGILASLSSEGTNAVLILIIPIIGLGIVLWKLRVTLRGIEVLTHGMNTKAHVVSVSNTNSTHNDRIVKKYIFEYMVGPHSYKWTYRSAYKRYLKKNSVVTLYYLPHNPSRAFVPEFYGLS